jgi:hypothetical protein
MSSCFIDSPHPHQQQTTYTIAQSSLYVSLSGYLYLIPSLSSSIYFVNKNIVFFHRSSTFLIGIMGSALAFEVAFDETAKYLWNVSNKGVSIKPTLIALTVILSCVPSFLAFIFIVPTVPSFPN